METKHKRKTGIRRKVSVVICAASALIVVAGVLLSYVLGSRLLYRMKGQEYVQISQLLANYISQNLTGDIEDIKTYAARPLWLDFANESNLKHVSLDKEAILRQLNDMDKQWLDSSRDSALVRQYVDNRIGVSMCEILKVRRYVSELFITDKSGALIAASNKTSDFYQADEGWWQKAHSSGKGDIYVGSLEFDESADTWGIAIAAPMKDQDGEVIGVCKEFLSAQQIFKPLQDLRMGRTGHAAMVDGNGKILFHSGIKPFSDEFINSSGFKKLLSGRKAYGIIQNAHTHKQKMFTAFSKVESPFLAGNGITWLVFIDQDVTEMLSPLYFLLGSLMAIVGILLLVITIPVGYAFGGVFAKPIHELHLATEHVIAGDLDYKIETKTGDEIEQLADAFREMISNIKGKQRELQNIASSFEEKVKERTTELERVNEATLNILEDLTEAKNKLETLNRLKSDFVSTVSHELRTPLSITKEGISLVLDKIPGAINEKQETLLRVSLDNINRLARIINELLDISKIESGKITPKQKLVDMTGLIKEAVSFFELKAQEKQLKLKADLPDKPVYLYVDPDMMKQVFDNLIANALKFTEKGRIDILVKEDASKIECIVADTGVGISREDLPKAFQKFEQFGRSYGPGEKGTGLGLSIAKGLIELHQGHIRVESELGKGTKFIFILPKRTYKEIFSEHVNNGIMEASKNGSQVSAIIVYMEELSKVKEKVPQEKLDALCLGIEKIVERVLRRTGDVALKDACEIMVVLPECDKQGAVRVSSRLNEALASYLKETDLGNIIRLRVGYATYPDEARNAEEMINKAKKA